MYVLSERSFLFQECHLYVSDVYIFAYRCSCEQIHGLVCDLTVCILYFLFSTTGNDHFYFERHYLGDHSDQAVWILMIQTCVWGKKKSGREKFPVHQRFYQHILLDNTKFNTDSINNYNTWHDLRTIMMFLCKETISYLAARSSLIIKFPLLLSLFSLFPLSGFRLFFLRFPLSLLFLQEVF